MSNRPKQFKPIKRQIQSQQTNSLHKVFEEFRERILRMEEANKYNTKNNE